MTHFVRRPAKWQQSRNRKIARQKEMAGWLKRRRFAIGLEETEQKIQQQQQKYNNNKKPARWRTHIRTTSNIHSNQQHAHQQLATSNMQQKQPQQQHADNAFQRDWLPLGTQAKGSQSHVAKVTAVSGLAKKKKKYMCIPPTFPPSAQPLWKPRHCGQKQWPSKAAVVYHFVRVCCVLFAAGMQTQAPFILFFFLFFSATPDPWVKIKKKKRKLVR